MRTNNKSFSINTDNKPQTQVDNSKVYEALGLAMSELSETVKNMNIKEYDKKLSTIKSQLDALKQATDNQTLDFNQLKQDNE